MKCYEEPEELDDCTSAGYETSHLKLHIPSNWRSIRDRWIQKTSHSCKYRFNLIAYFLFLHKYKF